MAFDPPPAAESTHIGFRAFLQHQLLEPIFAVDEPQPSQFQAPAAGGYPNVRGSRGADEIPSSEQMRRDDADKTAFHRSGCCSNTSRTMDKIKTRHGTHQDGWGPRGRAEMWIEPRTLFRHMPYSDVVQLPATDNGHFDSFNVCIEWRERDRHRRRAVEDLNIVSFHSIMCQSHCLEYMPQ